MGFFHTQKRQNMRNFKPEGSFWKNGISNQKYIFKVHVPALPQLQHYYSDVTLGWVASQSCVSRPGSSSARLRVILHLKRTEVLRLLLSVLEQKLKGRLWEETDPVRAWAS